MLVALHQGCFGPTIMEFIVGRFGTSVGTSEIDGRLTEDTEDAGQIFGVPVDLLSTTNLVHGPAVVKYAVRRFGTSVGTSEVDRRLTGDTKALTEDRSDTEEIHQTGTTTRVMKTTNAPLFETPKLPSRTSQRGESESQNLQQSQTPGYEIITAIYNCRPNFDPRDYLCNISTPTSKEMRTHINIIDPITSNQKKRYILRITDPFTRYAKLVEIPDKETITVAKALLDQWILRHGFYERNNQ